MQVILTDISKPININSFYGSITLLEANVWPSWSYPKFTTLFSYSRKNKDHVVPVIMGKNYTFHDLEVLVNLHLNVDEQVALLYHNNNRVTWRLFPNVKTTNIKLSKGLIDVLKLKSIAGTQTGEPVDLTSISFTFSDTSNIFITCDEIDDNIYFNNKKVKAITATPVVLKNGAITVKYPQPTVKFHSDFMQLKFRIQDDKGIDLPIKRLLLRLTINDKCL